MLYLIDKLTFILIYLSISFSNPDIFGIAIKKMIFVIVLISYVIHIVIHGTKMSTTAILYIIFSLTGITVLSTISLIKGNDFENIMLFVYPILFLIFIPVYKSLFEEYEAERYLNMFLSGSLILSLMIILIAVIVFIFDMGNDQYYTSIFNSIQDNIAISFPPGLFVRVQVNTAIMIIPGIIIAYYYYLKKKEKKYKWIIIISIVALIYTLSIGIWVGAMVGVILFRMLTLKLKLKNYLVTVIIILITLLVVSELLNKQSDYKGYSTDVKKQQTAKAIDLFIDNPFFGKGMGYLYKNMDERNTIDPYLEVAPVMLLSSGGLIGLCVYSFIYLFWLIFYFIKSSKHEIAKVFVSIHLSLFIATIANPYIWSGTQGLMFSSLLAAYLISNHKMPLNETIR